MVIVPYKEYFNEKAFLALEQFVTLFRADLVLLNSRWWWFFSTFVRLVCDQGWMKKVNICGNAAKARFMIQKIPGTSQNQRFLNMEF